MKQLTHEDLNVIPFKELIQCNFYANINENSPYQVLRYNELNDSIIQDKEDKGTRRFITFNTLKNNDINDKSEANISDYSRTIIIDFDLKNDTQIKPFLNDYKKGKFSDLSEAMNDFLHDLKEDSSVFITGRSASGKGIRIVFMVANRYNSNPCHMDRLDKFKASHKLNYDFIINVLMKKYSLNPGMKYFDHSPSSISLGTFTLQPFDFYYNPTCDIYNNSEKITVDNSITSSNQQLLPQNKLVSLNNDFITILHNISQSQNNIDAFKRYVRKNHLSYNFNFLCSIKVLPDEGRRVFYNIYRNHYAKDGHNNPNIIKAIQSFDHWNRFLDKLVVKYCTPIRNYFTNCSFINKNLPKKGEDIFNNPYTLEVTYQKYIFEQKVTIYKVFSNQKYIVLKAPAGGGKTTLMIDYIKEYLISNPNHNVCFTAPKLVIIEQIVNDHSQKFHNLIINYDGNHIDQDQINKGGNVIFSTFQSLAKLKGKYDVLIIDEAHDLVSYSDFDYALSSVAAPKVIYLSATPEPLLPIITKNCFYLNLQKENQHNPFLFTYWVNDTLSKLDELISKDRLQLIYLNDKQQGQRLQEKYLKQNIDFKLLNAKTKEEPHFQEIKEKSLLSHSHYIATEVIIEGINILNQKWDDIIILNNNTSTILHYYQLANRFRKIPNINYYYISTYENHNQTIDTDLNSKYSALKQQYETMISGITYTSGYNHIINTEYLNKEYDHYTVNEYKLANFIFRNTYNQIHSNREYFLKFFNYYFNVIEKVEYDKPENDIIEPSFIDFKIFLTKNYSDIKLILLGVSGVFDEEMEQYVLVNRKYFKKLVKRKELTDELNLNNEIIYSSDVEFNNQVKIAQFRLISGSNNVEGKDLLIKNNLLVVNKCINSLSGISFKDHKYILLDDVYRSLPKEVLISLTINNINHFSRVLKYRYSIQRKNVYTYEAVGLKFIKEKGLKLLNTRKLSFIIL